MVTGFDDLLPINATPSTAPGSWTCVLCGFRGFWRGGPHCLSPRSLQAQPGVRPRWTYAGTDEPMETGLAGDDD